MMTEQMVSKTAQVLRYFAEQYPGVPRTRLAKLVYMSDLLARQYLGQPISEFEYRKDNFGPYDRALPEYVAELEAAGLADNPRQTLGEGYRAYRLFSRGTIDFEFSAAEREVLLYVTKNYVNMPWSEFIDEVIYQTPPMASNPREGDRLDMDSQNHAGTREVGFQLEEILKAKDEIAAGNFTTSF